MKLSAAVLRLDLRGRHRAVPGRRRGRGRPVLAFLQGPAGLFAAAGLRAAGDDPRARHRRRAGRRVRPRAAALSADPGGPEAGHQRLPRGRGQELLRARRPRLQRHRPRRHASTCRTTASSRRPQGASTITQQVAKNFLLDQRGLARPQDQGSAARAAHRARLLEGQDPRALSQRDLSRARRLRHRGGLAASISTSRCTS